MAQLDLILPATPVAGIAEPHQSTVAAILLAAGRGLFTTAEAELMIDRLRTDATALSFSVEEAIAPEAAELADQS